jgi:Bacterial-like globin
MEHRRVLAHPEAHRPFVGSDLFARVGGCAAVETLVDGLYDRIETDPALRPLFSRDIAGERQIQKRFFNEWLGGEEDYSSDACRSSTATICCRSPAPSRANGSRIFAARSTAQCRMPRRGV